MKEVEQVEGMLFDFLNNLKYLKTSFKLDVQYAIENK